MNNNNIDVLVYGSIIMDFIFYVDRLPKSGETLHGKNYITNFGGKGANQCVASARLGAHTTLIAKVGYDSWANDYLHQLRKENVRTDFVQKCEGEKTGLAQILVAGGDNQIVIVTGANNKLNKKDVWSARALFATAKVLLCQLETPVEGTIEALRLFTGTSILNAAPAISNPSPDLLEAATILCVNQSEAALMCQVPDIKTVHEGKKAAQQLLKMGAHSVILTLGSHGVLYINEKNNEKCLYLPAGKVDKIVDTTGAGDAFIGAFAYHFARYPYVGIEQHLHFAIIVATYSVQYIGTQCSYPYADDIQIEDFSTKQFPHSFI